MHGTFPLYCSYLPFQSITNRWGFFKRRIWACLGSISLAGFSVPSVAIFFLFPSSSLALHYSLSLFYSLAFGLHPLLPLVALPCILCSLSVTILWAILQFIYCDIKHKKKTSIVIRVLQVFFVLLFVVSNETVCRHECSFKSVAFVTL